MASNTAGTPVTLPLEQRKWALQYENEDGTVGENAYPINYSEVTNLKGRVLTIIDATYADPQQRKAAKDVIWGEIRRWMEQIIRDGEERTPGLPTRPPLDTTEVQTYTVS